MIDNDNYPINLLNKVAGGNWEYELPYDIIGSLEYVLWQFPERDRRIIHARFRDKKTYVDIAKSEKLSTERVRQITARAIKKLAHPLRCDYLIYGVKGMENKAVQQEVNKQLYTAIKSITDIAEKLGNPVPDDVISVISPKFTKIDELNLSVRAYNCLKRSSLCTLEDVCALSLDELAKIRNLGKKAFDEVVEVVHERNRKFKGE